VTLYDFLSLKNYVSVAASKKTLRKKIIFVGILKVTDKKSRIRIRIRNIANVTDPQHCLLHSLCYHLVRERVGFDVVQPLEEREQGCRAAGLTVVVQSLFRHAVAVVAVVAAVAAVAAVPEVQQQHHIAQHSC
jgi:hypothetical protein